MEEKDLIAEEETNFITLTDENGVEAEFEFMECIEYQGKEYTGIGITVYATQGNVAIEE